MGIAKKIIVCAVCGYIAVKGLHIEHECRMGWCSIPVIEQPDTPHSEHEAIRMAQAEEQVMPPSRGMDWVPNDTANLRRQRHPAFDDNWSMNSGWLQAVSRR